MPGIVGHQERVWTVSISFDCASRDTFATPTTLVRASQHNLSEPCVPWYGAAQGQLRPNHSAPLFFSINAHQWSAALQPRAILSSRLDEACFAGRKCPMMSSSSMIGPEQPGWNFLRLICICSDRCLHRIWKTDFEDSDPLCLPKESLVGVVIIWALIQTTTPNVFPNEKAIVDGYTIFQVSSTLSSGVLSHNPNSSAWRWIQCAPVPLWTARSSDNVATQFRTEEVRLLPLQTMTEVFPAAVSTGSGMQFVRLGLPSAYWCELPFSVPRLCCPPLTAIPTLCSHPSIER